MRKYMIRCGLMLAVLGFANVFFVLGQIAGELDGLLRGGRPAIRGGHRYRAAGGDGAQQGNVGDRLPPPLHQLDAAEYLGVAADETLLFQHVEMVLDHRGRADIAAAGDIPDSGGVAPPFQEAADEF